MNIPPQSPGVEEGEVCRVCRTEAEPGNPLYHPCKCAGSIRYVHSECLVQWLGHSRKKNCELCGYAFSFKKVYPADMPSSLPIHTLCIRFARDALRTVLYALWGLIVAFNWLVLLPLTTMVIWKGLFSGGSTVAWKFTGAVVDTPQIPNFNRTAAGENLKGINGALVGGNISTIAVAAVVANITADKQNVTPKATWGDFVWMLRTILFELPQVRKLFLKTIQYRFVRHLKTDLLSTIVDGQILAVLIVITFLGVFLLREWVVQNGPIDNPAAEAPEMGGPARVEDFRPEMAVHWRWRRRRVIGRDTERRPIRPAPAFPARRRREIVPLDPVGDYLARRENALDGNVVDIMRDGPTIDTARMAAATREEDDEWVDEDLALPGPTTVDLQVPQAYPDETNRPPGPSLAELDLVAMREARNRYFAVRDHNRRFGELAPDVPSPGLTPGEVPSPFLRNQSLNTGPTYQSSFAFDFDMDAANGNSMAGPSRSREDSPFLRADSPDEDDSARPESPWGHGGPMGIGERFTVPLIDNERPPRPLDQHQMLERPLDEDEIQGPDERQDEEELDDGQDAEGLILEGDLEGIVETLGLAGPPIVLVQNTFIVIIVLTATLALFINIPYVIGKIHLLGDVSMIGLPARGLFKIARAATILTDYLLIAVTKSLNVLVIRPIKGRFSSGIVIDSPVPETMEQSLSTRFNEFLTRLIPSALRSPGQSVFDLVESGFELLGQQYTAFRQVAYSIGESDTSTSRFIAVATGYFDIVCTLLFMSALGERGLGSVGKAVSEAVASHGVVLKLGFFMIIELAIFPMSMGYVIDFCALPLFPSSTLGNRVVLQSRHPYLSLFIHWLCGTLFMFAFAKFLNACRKICRRGAMYMIRDPQDPSFSPVRDILDKTVINQIQKLCLSACMYLAVLTGPVGGLLVMFRYALPQRLRFLPLRWYYEETQSTVAFDFLFLLFVVPHTLGKLQLGSIFRYVLRKYWATLAKWLRLSSYFYGVRYPEEQHVGRLEQRILDIHRRWIVFKRAITRSKAPLPKYEGTEMRVPYADAVPLVKPRQHVFIEVDEKGVPLTDAGKIAAVLQERVGVKANRNVRQDYTQVYLPPLYSHRFWIFAMLIWIGVSWTCALALFLPITIGRNVIEAGLGRPVHDGYSFFIGVYLMLFIRPFAMKIAEFFSRRFGNTLPATKYAPTIFSTEYMKRKGRKVARLAFYLLIGGFAIPTALALVIDLFVLFPIKYGVSDMTPVCYIVEDWALGVAVMAICYLRSPIRRRILGLMAPANTPDIEEWFLNTLRTRKFSHEVLLPSAIAWMATVILPAVAAFAITIVFRSSNETAALTYRFIYPLILSAYLGLRGARMAYYYLTKWSVNSLESVYLLEKRVMNMEDAETPGSSIKVLDPNLHVAEMNHGHGDDVIAF